MWMSWEAMPQKKGVNQQEAASFCSTLQIGGITGWRLPTEAELNADTSMQPPRPDPRSGRFFNPDAIVITYLTYVWTSTLDGPDSAVAVSFGRPWNMDRHDVIDATGTFHKVKLTKSKSMGVICTRQMEPEIVQAAKEAEVGFPVESLQVLEVNVPLRLAREAFEAGKYQDCLVQTKRALQIMPQSAFSHWADGICSGMAGQWDDAIADEQAAVKLDRTFRDARYALKWAQNDKVHGLDTDRRKWPTWQGNQY
jgi:hypothetical protein